MLSTSYTSIFSLFREKYLATFLAANHTTEKLEQACAILLAKRYQEDNGSAFIQGHFAAEKYLLIELAKKTMNLKKEEALKLPKITGIDTTSDKQEQLVFSKFKDSLQKIIQANATLVGFKNALLDCIANILDPVIESVFTSAEFSQIELNQMIHNQQSTVIGIKRKSHGFSTKFLNGLDDSLGPISPSSSNASTYQASQNDDLEALITSFLAETNSTRSQFFVIDKILYVYFPDKSMINKLAQVTDDSFQILITNLITKCTEIKFFTILFNNGFNPTYKQLSKILSFNNPIRNFYIDHLKLNDKQEDAIKYFLAVILETNPLLNINSSTLASIAQLTTSIHTFIDQKGLDEKPWYFKDSAKTCFNKAKENLWQIPPKLLFGLIAHIVQTKLNSPKSKNAPDKEDLEMESKNKATSSSINQGDDDFNQDKKSINTIFSLAIDNYIDHYINLPNFSFNTYVPSLMAELKAILAEHEDIENPSRTNLLNYKLFRLSNTNDYSSGEFKPYQEAIYTTVQSLSDNNTRNIYLRQLAKIDNDLWKTVIDSLPKTDTATSQNQSDQDDTYQAGSRVGLF